MAATEQVLSTLARLGNLGLGGVETPENRPSEQDSSLFSALLEESGGGNRSPEDKPAARKTEDDGNGLPALPVAMPIAAPVATPVAEKAPAEDSELEDFAVKLSIDRSLARLLLTQTSGAPAADATMAPVATPDVSGFNAAFQNAALPNVLPTATAESAGSGTDGLSSAGFTASLLVAGAANVADADETPSADAAIAANATPASPEVDSAVATPPSAPTLTQLDLARLTAVPVSSPAPVSTGPVSIDIPSASSNVPTASTRDAAIAPTTFTVPPALSVAPESLTPIAAAPLGDEDLLRWRSIAARAEPVVGKLDSAATAATTAEIGRAHV